MKKRNKILILSVMVLTIILILTYGISYAKYASNHVWNYYLESKGFYFNSDILSKNNVNNNWDGSSVHFDIKNSLNSLVASEFNINYKVKCSIKDNVDASCFINNTNSDTYSATLSNVYGCVDLVNKTDVSSYKKDECVSNGYDYRARETSADLYFDVVSNTEDEVDNVTVVIEAESTYPYKKTISSEFILSRGIDEKGNIDLTYSEYSDYSNVIISNTYTLDKCVKLSFDSTKFRVDNSDISKYAVDGNGYKNELIFNISSKDYKLLKFYRVDKNVSYDSSEFEIIESNEC